MLMEIEREEVRKSGGVDVMANDMSKVRINKEVAGDRVKLTYRTRVTDSKYLEEKVKEKKKKKRIYA